ncbi:MAG TPA: PIG-L family deacetylase, partial [Bryobacteraceae bacterium]|nr:PIG-L family deacetylase [Bryobacteraceae bacterium]
AGSGDYLMAAGGTLAALIDQGYSVHVVQFANDEKNSVGLSPAETRLANNADGEHAARTLGIRDILNLNHKSGELGQVSSNEMRNQIFALIRYYKPQIIFHPDPWIHYEPDRDQFWIGRVGEESSYGSGNTFLAEIGRMGFPGFGVRETYWYATNRPYRPGEGGGPSARFRPVDITATFHRKVAALEELRTANRAYAVQVKQKLEMFGKPSPLLREVNEGTTKALIGAYAEELAETIGKKHGFRYGEEFNYNGGGNPIPEHIREHAQPIP